MIALVVFISLAVLIGLGRCPPAPLGRSVVVVGHVGVIGLLGRPVLSVGQSCGLVGLGDIPLRRLIDLVLWLVLSLTFFCLSLFLFFLVV